MFVSAFFRQVKPIQSCGQLIDDQVGLSQVGRGQIAGIALSQRAKRPNEGEGVCSRIGDQCLRIPVDGVEVQLVFSNQPGKTLKGNKPDLVPCRCQPVAQSGVRLDITARP